MRSLYLAYYPRLFRFVLRMTRDSGLAEEVVNDTMLMVWRGAAAFRGESRVSTWIIGIAYRRALKALAARKRRLPAVAFEQGAVEGRESAPAVDQVAATVEVQDWIEHALDGLSPEHRLTLELAYFLGESCEEIALIADCPVGTVKTRLHHARIRLHRHLLEHATPHAAISAGGTVNVTRRGST